MGCGAIKGGVLSPRPFDPDSEPDLRRPRSDSGKRRSTIRWIWSGCKRVLKCEAMITSFSNRSARSMMSSRWVWPNLWMTEARSPGATKVISRISTSAR